VSKDLVAEIHEGSLATRKTETGLISLRPLKMV